MEWEAILSDKSFQAQPPAVKARVAANYFRENIASDPSFAEQPEDVKSRVRGNFFSTIMEKPSFEARYPTLSAIEKTFRGVPRVIASGATLGLSERARESAQMLTGTKEDEPYSEIPSLSRGVGEFTGAAIPIGAVGTAIHKVTEIPKVATALSKNKWFEPLARMTGWGVAGGAYDTAESMIKRGEAPSLKDIAKSGAIWGGTEAALSSLGWTGRLASAVNTLAKSAGVSRVQMLNAIIKEAAERGLPVGMTAKKVVGEKAVQDAWDTFLKEKEAQAQDYLERLDLLSQGETVKPDANTSAMQKMLGITEEGMPTGAAEVVHGKSAPEFTHGTAAATRLPKSMEVASGSKSRLTKAEPGGARPVSELELEQVGRTESPAYEATEQGVIRSAPTEGDRMAALEGQRTADIAESIGAGGQVNTAVDDILSRTPFARSLADQLNRLKTLALPPGLSVEQHFVALSEQVGRLAFLSESDKRRLLRAVEKDKAVALERERQAQMDEAAKTTAEVPREAAKASPAQEIRPAEAFNPEDMAKDTGRVEIVQPGATSVAGASESVVTRGSAGAIAGVGTDEEGNLTYDPVKGAAGMAGGIGLAGIIFRSKGPVKTLGRAPVTDAERVKAMYDETAAEIAKREAFSIQNVKDAVKRNVLDVSSKAKDMLANLNHPLSKEAVMRRDLIAGANSAAVQQFSQYEKNIYGGLQQGEEAILDRIINSRRTVQIGEYKDISHSRGLKPEQHKKYLDDIAGAEGIAKERADDLAARSDAYFAAMDDQLKQRLDAGLISQKQYDELSKYVYSPRRFFEHLDDIDRKISGRSITVGSSGIKGLQEGSEGLMETRTRGLLADHVSRTQDLIFRNKANQSLVQLANDLPENGVVRLAKRIGTRGTTGEPIYAEAPNGYEKLSAMVDGQQVPFIVPREFADSWVKSDPMIQGALAQTLSWLSGSKILKAGATGYNPFFVLTNMPRDMALIWSGEQYSKHLPVAMGQMAKDLWTVAPDVFKRKGRVADYINEGGGMELLTHYGRFKGASEVGQKLNLASRVLGWVGETSELWTRLAHRERAMKNGLSPVEATYTARTGSIDFSQGGSMIKAVDTVVPYLNAAIQGTRTLGRNAAKNPGTFTYKMAQLGVASAMLYAWNMQNPEAWSQISDRDKEANFIFIIPDVMPGATSYIDDKGAKRYRYIKIAKDQAQRVFTTAVESILQYGYEGKKPTKQAFAALSDLGVPWRVPALSALIAMGNYDDYTFDQIWRGPEGIAAQEEYRQDTPGIYVAAGKATGLSPERMRAATNKILPQNNPFISAFGTGVKTATGETSEELARKGWNQFVSESPSIRRVFAITSPSVGYQEQLEEEREASRTENFKQNRELDNLTQKFFKSGKQEDGQKVLAYVQSQPEAVQDRLVKRYEAAYEIKDLPDKGFWKQLRSMAPEARAKVLHKRIMEAKGPEQARLLETANNLSGIVSDRMVEEWNRLTAGK